MSLELYYLGPSPPCRAVMLLLKAIDLSPEMKPVNVMEGEHLSEEFLQLNPQHTIPVLVDDGFPIAESRSIMMYLADNYTENESLYPKDPKQRAIVNQRLFFDIGTLFTRFAECYHPVIWKGEGINENLVVKVEEAFSILNTFLEGHDWVAGDEMTIADFSIVVTVSTAEGVGFDLSPYSNVVDWLQRCKDNMVDYEEVNQANLDHFVEHWKGKLGEQGE
ncbi:hypothetical protein AAG570_003547 [Ranatra chinensis]|uniref:Uncharacterized protein n=1 Tax=Ranatra chinensis TaxID=642074 RepID=A0ABD0YGI8_9HEMI